MRFITNVETPSEIKRLMIHETDEGAYLFLYRTNEDGPCFADLWFANVKDAKMHAKENFGVSNSNWNEIPDPLSGCQQDWIASVRVLGRDTGNPQWGHFEILKNGNWVHIERISSI